MPAVWRGNCGNLVVEVSGNLVVEVSGNPGSSGDVMVASTAAHSGPGRPFPAARPRAAGVRPDRTGNSSRYAPSPGHEPAATAQTGNDPTDTTGNDAGHTPPRQPHPDAANRHAGRPTTAPPHRPDTTTNQPRDHRTRPQARPHARHRTAHQARDHHQARPTARPRHTTTEPPPRAATARRPNHATTRAGPAGRAHDREPPQERGDGARSTPPRVARFGPGIRLRLFPAARPNTPRAAGCPTRPTGAESDCRSRPDPPSAESLARLPRASNPAGCGTRPRAGGTLRRPAGRTGPQRRRGEGETAKTPTQAPPSRIPEGPRPQNPGRARLPSTRPARTYTREATAGTNGDGNDGAEPEIQRHAPRTAEVILHEVSRGRSWEGPLPTISRSFCSA